MGEGDWLLLILYFLFFIDYLSFFDFSLNRVDRFFLHFTFSILYFTI